MTKPYSFQPVYAFEDAIDLGTRLFNGQAGWLELEDANGISGCAIRKYRQDSGDAAPPLAATEDLSGLSLRDLGKRLREAGEEARAMPAIEQATGAIWTLLLPIIMEIIKRLLSGGGILGGDGTTPAPGPV